MLKALKALTGIAAALRRGARKATKSGEALRRAPQAPACGYPNHMYLVTECGPGDFLCDVMVQDGRERWHEGSLKKAIQSVISGAEVLNGEVIGIDGVSVLLRPAPR
jgi:hypothetical protein